MYIFQNPIK